MRTLGLLVLVWLIFPLPVEILAGLYWAGWSLMRLEPLWLQYTLIFIVVAQQALLALAGLLATIVYTKDLVLMVRRPVREVAPIVEPLGGLAD